MLKNNPKMAAMMMGYNQSNKALVYSYHGYLSLFDDQDYFNATFRDPMEFYRATSNKNDGVVFERDVNNEVVEEMIEKILFEVFLYEFKQQYVGKDTPALRSFILAYTTRAITSIKASFIHSITRARINITR